MIPKVSITMSTYNVEDFIQESLDCIVNQTLKEIEIICIDDGSTDKTLNILNEYATKDSRINVIAKPKNEGLAVARNEALALATGKYITFVDGDDLIDITLFEKAFKLAEKNNSDLVVWDYINFSSENEINIEKGKVSQLLNISKTNKIDLLKFPSFSCVKMIKNEVVNSLNISFPVGLTRQDIPVNWKLITSLENINLLPERLYFYRQHPEATTHRTDNRLFDLATVMDITEEYLPEATTHRTDNRLFDLATVMDITEEYLIENNLYEQYKDEFLRQQLGLLAGMYDKVDSSLKPKALKIIIERLENNQWDYILNKKSLRWQTRDFYLAINGSVVAKIKRALWLSIRYIYRSLK